MNGDDVRVADRGHRARLPLEPGQRINDVGGTSWKHLNRHVAPEPRVVRAVHLAHAARPDRPSYFVRTKPSTGRELPGFVEQFLPERTVECAAGRQERILVVAL